MIQRVPTSRSDTSFLHVKDTHTSSGLMQKPSETELFSKHKNYFFLLFANDAALPGAPIPRFFLLAGTCVCASKLSRSSTAFLSATSVMFPKYPQKRGLVQLD
jgi:hypothetical protein